MQKSKLPENSSLTHGERKVIEEEEPSLTE